MSLIVQTGAAQYRTDENDSWHPLLIRADVALDTLVDKYDATQTKTWAKDELCLHNAEVYKCNNGVSTPKAWTASDWTRTTLSYEINAIRNALTGLEDEVIISDTQPIEANNKLWVKETSSSDGVSIPTMGDISVIQNTITNAGKNPLAGKKVGFWGDSIQYGLLQDASRSAQNYPAVFGQLTGATIENNAYSGASITNYDSHSFINIYNTINWNLYDYVVLAYGANDVGHGETIENITTAFNTVCGYIMNYNPNVVLALCSPTYGTNLAGRYSPSNICLNDVYYIVRNVAKAHKIKFIDFLYGASINQYNISTLAWDGLHFNDAGYYKLGEYLASNLLGETIHDVIDFGTHAQKLQVQHFGGNNGCNLYIYGDDNTIYSVTFFTNSLALIKSDDGGINWTTLWTIYPST